MLIILFSPILTFEIMRKQKYCGANTYEENRMYRIDSAAGKHVKFSLFQSCSSYLF